MMTPEETAARMVTRYGREQALRIVADYIMAHDRGSHAAEYWRLVDAAITGARH